MSFPDFKDWKEIVVNPIEKDQYRTCDYDYYKEKYEICLRFKPRTIAEIGVRYGYSLASFLFASPEAEAYGYDMINGGNGGPQEIDTFEYVAPMLGKNFPLAKINLIHRNTQLMNLLDRSFDFVHVDGSHSEDHCTHDMETVFLTCPSRMVMLVDDYTYIDGVKRAVDKFLEKRSNEIESSEKIDGFRGNCIIVKKATENV